MRGKYANLAEKRQAMAELEERVLGAERALARAETGIADERKRSSAEIASLKARLQDLTAQRNAGEGPATIRLQEQNEALRGELKESRQMHKADVEKFRALSDGFISYLVKGQGLTVSEAMELLLNFVPGKHGVTRVSRVQGKSAGRNLAVGAEMQLQVARGERHREDFLSLALGRDVTEADQANCADTKADLVTRGPEIPA